MPRVVMTIHISGSRDGEDWPVAGEGIDVPADEAASLIANGLASAAPPRETPVIETADLTPTKTKGLNTRSDR
jgi:hypothetical protein